MEFPTREGTDNPGLDYEKEIAALLAIRYAFEESVQDFWIGTNVDCVGDTDDVVLCITAKNDDKLVILLQLKHENPVGEPKTFKDSDFTYLMNDKRRDKAKERFSLDKYFKGYKNLQTRLKSFEEEEPVLIQYLRTVNQFAYVLYTNRGLEEKLNCLTNANENVIFNHLNTSIKSTYYGFSPEEFNLDQDFIQNLYLFPNQINFESVFNLIKSEIRKLFGKHKFAHVDFDDVTKRYLEIIKLWTKGCEIEKKTKYITLTKRDIINILSDVLLESYKYNIEENQFSYYDCPQKSIWNKLMLLKDISIVYEDDLTVKFLKEYVGSEVKLITKKQGKYWYTEVAKSASNAFCEAIPNDQVQIMKICGNSNNDCITMVSIYKFMWFYKNLPLLLKIDEEEEYNDVLKILKLSENKLKIIVILTDQDLDCRKSTKQVNHFASLKDIEPLERSEILNLPVRFQGRISLPLSEIAKANMFQSLKCADIIHILCNDFNVGNKFVFKFKDSENCYIQRSVLKILIAFEALVEIENEIFLIEAQNTNECERILTEELASFDFNIKNCPNVCVLDPKGISKRIEKLKKTHECFHRLLFDEDFLEWQGSTESIENIAEFQIFDIKSKTEKLYDDVSKFLSSINTNKFQIISACPGMGKSVLLNYITCFANSDVWILPITLRDVAEKDEMLEDPSEFFRLYIDQLLSDDSSVQNMEFSLMVIEDMIKKKKILLLLDGFDEISISHKEEFSSLLEYFYEEKYPAIITTRENMALFLENKFNALSKTLKYFTFDEQTQFLTNFFKLNFPVKNKIGNDILIDFVEQLLSAAEHNLSDRDGEFTGIPLQLSLLGDYFLKDYKESIRTKKVCLSKKFNLLDLYEKFIKNKTAILCKKYGSGEKDWLKSLENDQHLFALQYIFDSLLLQPLNIEKRLEQYYEAEEYKSQLMQKEGILIAIPMKDKIAIHFIHRTFAEYLAAQWLIKNLKSVKFRDVVSQLIEVKRLDGSNHYKFLFVVFDRILAKECKFHLDIINVKVDDIKSKVESNPNILIETDKLNRTSIHMLALYADEYTDQDLKEILDISPLENLIGHLDTLDNLTGYSALDFALFRCNFTFANILCQFSRYLKINDYDISYTSIEKHCFEYKFLYLTIFHNHLCRDLLQGDLYEDVNILDFTIKFCKNVGLSNEIFKFVRDISTVGEYLKFCGIKDAKKYYYHDIRFAIAYGSKENVENLLSKDLDINRVDSINRYTLLHYATINNRSDVVELLLNEGAEVNLASKKDTSTVVHSAAWAGCIGILEKYIENNADINMRDSSHCTPIDIAIISKNVYVALTLLKHNAEFSNYRFVRHYSLTDIVELGNIELVQEALKKGFKINEDSFKGITPLHTAIENNHVDIAKFLINQHCDFKSDNASNSLLHLTAKIGNLEFLQLFLDSGLNINKKNEFGETPLMIAIKYNHAEFVDILLSNNADVFATSNYEDPFFVAIAKGNEKIVSQLILKGRDVNKRDDYGNTAVLVALHEGKLNTVNFLLQQGADVHVQNDFGCTTLHYAAIYGYQDLVIQFLGDGVDINKETKDSDTALLLALKNSFIEVAKLLISKSAIVNIINREKCNSLHYAAELGDITLVQDLIDAGAEINLQNDCGLTPLELAILHKKSDIVQLFLSHDADLTLITKKGSSILHMAAAAGNNEVIMLCLEKSFGINEEDSQGRTPLFCALDNKRFETAEFLIKNGADITINCGVHDSALRNAARIGYDDLVMVLLNKGLDINGRESLGETALSIALLSCNLSTAKLLHMKGAEIDIKRGDRSTTLHLAATCGYNELIIECIDKGYDVNSVNVDCNIPIDFAIMQNNIETVRLLIECGAIPSMLTFGLYVDMEVHTELEEQEKIECFKLLLEKFGNVNLKDKDGNTILHYICKSDFIRNSENECNFDENFYRAAVEILINLGAEFHLNNGEYKCAYDLAVERNLEMILPIFDQNSPKINEMVMKLDQLNLVQKFSKITIQDT